ncbi:hypothetical protein ACF06P_35655 [Streptomyces sp. NPDC015684]|uniref:hypothetical protein n=1 Tax=Streptomyces sp. NPDC015684 TaxID=3364963 RepID=UPI0037032B2A
MQPPFTRGFRLHHNGRYLDGAEFPSGRVFVLDDPDYGFATVAVSLDDLLKGYHGATVEWPAEPVAAHPPQDAWRVEYRRGDVWLPVRPTRDRQRAVDDLAARRERHPDFEFRLVHVNTTYTVEEP